MLFLASPHLIARVRWRGCSVLHVNKVNSTLRRTASCTQGCVRRRRCTYAAFGVAFACTIHVSYVLAVGSDFFQQEPRDILLGFLFGTSVRSWDSPACAVQGSGYCTHVTDLYHLYRASETAAASSQLPWQQCFQCNHRHHRHNRHHRYHLHLDCITISISRRQHERSTSPIILV